MNIATLLLFDILSEKIYNLVADFILIFLLSFSESTHLIMGAFLLRKKYNKNTICFNIAIANYSKLCYIMYRNSNSTRKEI